MNSVLFKSKPAISLREALLLFFIPLLLSCAATPAPADEHSHQKEIRSVQGTNAFPETFEAGTKRSYADAAVNLSTGQWQLSNALIGKSDKDAKADNASVRIAGQGSITMLFDVNTDVASVSFQYAAYAGDKGTQLSLWCSTDNGQHWRQCGDAIAVSTNSLSSASVSKSNKGAIRFSLHNDGDERANVDDFDIHASNGLAVTGIGLTGTGDRDENMALGNPSDATTDEGNKANYLLVHPQYALSYNNDKGIPNWVSWHLSMAWRGTSPRCNCFSSDNALPAGFYHAVTSDYIGSGFQRGHLCPSDDRTSSDEDNAATFLMPNISPQTPALNQYSWEGLEAYSRKLISGGLELYIIAGSYGTGGVGEKGAMSTIARGRITVPAHYWKIVVILPVGSDDLHRISKDTRVLAVDMPNIPTVNDQDWDTYRTSVNSIEQKTGYHFFSKLPPDVARAIKSKVDTVPIE